MTLPSSGPLSISQINTVMGRSATTANTSLAWVNSVTKAAFRPAVPRMNAYYGFNGYQRNVDGNCNNGNCTTVCNCRGQHVWWNWRNCNCTPFTIYPVNCANCDTTVWLQPNCNCACVYNCTTSNCNCVCSLWGGCGGGCAGCGNGCGGCGGGCAGCGGT